MSGYNRPIEIEESEAAFLLKKGIEYSKNGNSQKAIYYYSISLAKKKSPEIFYLLAKEYQKIKNFTQAILFYYKAIEEKNLLNRDQLIESYINLGILLFAYKNRSIDAISFLKKAISLDKDNYKAYGILLEILAENENYDEAEGIINYLISKNQDDYTTYYYAGNFYLKKGDYQKATEFLIKSFELYPENDYKTYLKSLTYEKVKASYGNIEEKINLLAQKETKLLKDYIELGFLYLFKEDYDKAIESFNTAKEMLLKK